MSSVKHSHDFELCIGAFSNIIFKLIPHQQKDGCVSTIWLRCPKTAVIN